jgi:TonB family protein
VPPGTNKTLLVVAGLMLLAAIGYEAWTRWTLQRELMNVTPAATVVRPVAVPKPPKVAPPVTPSPEAQPDQSSVAPAGTDASAAAPKTEDTNDSPDVAASPEISSRSKSGAANKAAAQGKGSAQPQKNKEQPALPKPRNSAANREAAPPNITKIAATGSMPKLIGPENEPTPVLQSVTLSPAVAQALLIKKTQPVYPQNSLWLRTDGDVQLLATVSKSGDVSALKVLSGNPSLARAATDAVKQWKYKPYLLNGVPVEIQTPVTITFKLPH